jgi:hypothetical protein
MTVTGYTSKVIDGKIVTLQAYAECCAAAFLFCMRDSPLEQLPDMVKPSTYYAEALASAESERDRLATMTIDQQDVAWRSDEAEQNADLQRQLDENAAEWERHDRMRKNVEAWDVPNQFVELKRFMLQQLHISIPMSADVIRRYNPLVKPSRDAWYTKALAEAESKVERARLGFRNEVDKAERETRFIHDLQACFNRT